MDSKLIKALIAENKVEEALEKMLADTVGTRRHNQVVLQSNRLKTLLAGQRKGTVSIADEQLTKNQIIDALLSILDGASPEDSLTPIPGEKNKPERNTLKWGLALLAGFLTILATIAGVSGYTLRDLFPRQEARREISATVFVHGKSGRHDLVLRQQGHVLMDVEGGERKKEFIDDKGSATFKNVMEGEQVRIDVDFSEPYKALYPDSVYRIPADGSIYLAVGLLHLDRVFGTVIWNDHPLPGVQVSIGDLRDTSEATGSYAITIPEQQQRQAQEVKFIKDGFKMLIKTAYPQTNQPLNVVMEQ